jgi:hypothetical protein
MMAFWSQSTAPRRHGARLLLACLLLLQNAVSLRAWGPHTQITRAALAVVPDREAWQQRLGDDWDRIARDYCWMADWRMTVRPDHYADDYLLYPDMRRHVNHLLPEVRETYRHHFRRALQAVRTESPQNAARWIGSLLHFVQDSGSPPHTIGLGGPLHTKMENWLDASQIQIDGYQPHLLGRTAAEAEQGFLARIAAQIGHAAFSLQLQKTTVRAETAERICARVLVRKKMGLTARVPRTYTCRVAGSRPAKTGKP